MRRIMKKIGTDNIQIVIFTTLANFFAYLYQFVMGRMLSPVDYGTLSSLLSVVVIFGIFASTLQLTVAKTVISLMAKKHMNQVFALFNSGIKKALGWGIVLFVFALLTVPYLQNLLHIEQWEYFAILFTQLLFIFLTGLNNGMQQGLYRFTRYGFTGLASSLTKLLVAILLVYLGFGIVGGLIGPVIGTILGASVGLFFLRDMNKDVRQNYRFRHLLDYSSLTFISLLMIALITNLDILLAKHFLSPEQAGEYSAIAILGRIVLAAPAGLAIVLFSKAAKEKEGTGSHKAVFLKSVALVLIIAGTASIAYWLFPELIIKFLFGSKYIDMAQYLGLYSVAMVGLAVLTLTNQYFLSIKSKRLMIVLGTGVVLQIGLICFLHNTIQEIVTALVIANLVSVIIGAICLFIKEQDTPKRTVWRIPVN